MKKALQSDWGKLQGRIQYSNKKTISKDGLVVYGFRQ